MFVCKICDEEYDENMRYSRDSRYCKKCGEERTQYLTYRRDNLASLRSIDYSCAVTPQIRQMGNHLSGNAGTAYASLLA